MKTYKTNKSVSKWLKNLKIPNIETPLFDKLLRGYLVKKKENGITLKEFKNGEYECHAGEVLEGGHHPHHNFIADGSCDRGEFCLARDGT